MADHDAEISIQDVNLLNAKIFFDGWMYVTIRDKRNPACFAPYFTEECRKESIPPGISVVSRVIRSETIVLTEEHEVGAILPSEEHLQRWRHGLARIIVRAKKEGFLNTKQQLRYLDRPQELCVPPITKREHVAWVKTFPEGERKRITPRISKGFSLSCDELRSYIEDPETASRPAGIDLQAMCAIRP